MAKSEFGFTLPEVLVVLGASTLVGVILITILAQTTGYFTSQNTEINQSLALNNLSLALSQNIQYSSGIATSFTSGTTQYVSNSTTLVAKLPSLDFQGGILDNKFDNMVITKDTQKPTVLRKYLFPDPASSRKSDNTVIATNLSYLQFTYLNDGGLTVAPSSSTRVDYIIKVAEKNGLATKESSLSGRINLKNI